VVDMGDVEEVHENNDTCMHVCMIPCSKWCCTIKM
jgi:hypothetical protein